MQLRTHFIQLIDANPVSSSILFLDPFFSLNGYSLFSHEVHMSQAFLPFSRPSIGDEEVAAVEQVLRSGWITTGPKNQALEEHFANYVGCRHAVALSSATGGMHITLLALGIGPGDEVITPSQTWVSTA